MCPSAPRIPLFLSKKKVHLSLSLPQTAHFVVEDKVHTDKSMQTGTELLYAIRVPKAATLNNPILQIGCSVCAALITQYSLHALGFFSVCT